MDNEILKSLKEIREMIFKTPEINQYGSFNLTQFEILKYIILNKDKEIYQKDLEEHLKLRKSTVSGVLSTMEKNNLIVRVGSKKDARLKQIVLTEDTKKIYAKKLKQLKSLETKMIQGISKENLDIFKEVLKEMKNNLKN